MPPGWKRSSTAAMKQPLSGLNSNGCVKRRPARAKTHRNDSWRRGSVASAGLFANRHRRLASGADQSGQVFRRLVANHMVTGGAGVPVREPARQFAEMSVEPVVHDLDGAGTDKRLQPGSLRLGNLVQRVTSIVEHVCAVLKFLLV